MSYNNFDYKLLIGFIMFFDFCVFFKLIENIYISNKFWVMCDGIFFDYSLLVIFYFFFVVYILNGKMI